MLKSYKELVKIDVTPFCETREAKDDRGKSVQIPYLNWAKCKDLLHENGANDVWFEPIANKDGSLVFTNAEVETKPKDNQPARKCGCYFVKVKIHIDDKEFDYDYPLMNGANVVYADTLNQLRISNAHARAFVKGVAVRTGLGFSLWLKENDEELALRTMADEDLTKHSIFAIKKRIEELLTFKIQNSGKTKEEILKKLGLNEKTLMVYLGYFEALNKLEKAMGEV